MIVFVSDRTSVSVEKVWREDIFRPTVRDEELHKTKPVMIMGLKQKTVSWQEMKLKKSMLFHVTKSIVMNVQGLVVVISWELIQGNYMLC
jgi:hypothetical protein